MQAGRVWSRACAGVACSDPSGWGGSRLAWRAAQGLHLCLGSPALRSRTPCCAHFSRLPWDGTAGAQQACYACSGRHGSSWGNAVAGVASCPSSQDWQLLRGPSSVATTCPAQAVLHSSAHRLLPPALDCDLLLSGSLSQPTRAAQVLLELLVHVLQAAGHLLALHPCGAASGRVAGPEGCTLRGTATLAKALLRLLAAPPVRQDKDEEDLPAAPRRTAPWPAWWVGVGRGHIDQSAAYRATAREAIRAMLQRHGPQTQVGVVSQAVEEGKGGRGGHLAVCVYVYAYVCGWVSGWWWWWWW